MLEKVPRKEGGKKRKREVSRMQHAQRRMRTIGTWIACVLPMLSSDMAPHAVRKVLLFS